MTDHKTRWSVPPAPLSGGAADLDFAAEHGEEAGEAGLPIGVEVDVLKLALDGARDCAFVEAEGDDEDLIERDAAGAIERVADFGLEAALFSDAAPGEIGRAHV